MSLNGLADEKPADCGRRLVELLKSSRDPIVLAVAAHDVGQYIKYGGEKAKQ